jgi:hypothetical protein
MMTIAIWLAYFFEVPPIADPLRSLAWHIHEMLFGFVMAAVAGFLRRLSELDRAAAVPVPARSARESVAVGPGPA